MTHEHEHEHHAEHHAKSYADWIDSQRVAKDRYFAGAPSSPIPAEARHDFTGLPYFDVDPGLRFEGLTLEPYAGDAPSAFTIPTSDGQLRPAHRAGTFRFAVAGALQSLTAYVLDGGSAESLFVPFLDATSGTESYGAGRYLDLEAEADGTYVLDLNLAYHPYCVYNATYSCPLTPAENRLPVRIEAGERL